MNDRSKTSRKAIWIGATAVVLIGVWWFAHRGKQTDQGQAETAEVTRGDLRETVSATGSLEALQTVQVGTQVSGTIDKIYVDFNSKVKKNQLLALIEPSVLNAQLESAQAALSQAQARYNDAKAALDEGEGLLAKHYIAEHDLRTLKVNATTAKAQVDAAQADYDRAKRNRQFAEIRSPIDGVVIDRAVDQGQTVAASFQTPTLFTIAKDLSQMQIIASVDESQIGDVQVGQQATFSVSAFPSKTFQATVRQIRLKPTVTQNVVTYSVVLDVANATGELFPGMTATVDFVLKDIPNALRVPISALRIQRVPESMMDAATLKRTQEIASRLNGEGGNLTAEQRQAIRQRMAEAQSGGRNAFGGVWVMNADGTAHRVAVRVLASDMSQSAVQPVRGELKAGDRVITRLSEAQTQGSTRSVFPSPGRRH